MTHRYMITYIETHPAFAFLIGGIHLFLANRLQTLEIPTIVMQLFQIGAWTTTIAVAMISIYGAWKRRK